MFSLPSSFPLVFDVFIVNLYCLSYCFLLLLTQFEGAVIERLYWYNDIKLLDLFRACLWCVYYHLYWFIGLIGFLSASVSRQLTRDSSKHNINTGDYFDLHNKSLANKPIPATHAECYAEVLLWKPIPEIPLCLLQRHANSGVMSRSAGFVSRDGLAYISLSQVFLLKSLLKRTWLVLKHMLAWSCRSFQLASEDLIQLNAWSILLA